MAQIPASLKQLVRDYLDARTQIDDPPPSRDEIRHQLGWDMIPENRLPEQQDNE